MLRQHDPYAALKDHGDLDLTCLDGRIGVTLENIDELLAECEEYPEEHDG